MSKDTSPFISYTVDEIFRSEAVTWVIQVGSELYQVNDNFFFSKGAAAKYLEKITTEVAFEYSHGTLREKANARKLIGHIHMLPLRIH